MRRRFVPIVLFFATFLVALPNAVAVTIDTVPVGDIGNPNDPTNGNVYGSVNYAYSIGTREVTNAQYVDFLNAKAASDPLALYNTNMGTNIFGGITRSGVSGSFTYSSRPDMANKPVTYVNWYDSIRFANWLNNGQGNGDTETGAYTLLGGTPTPSNGDSITRNPGSIWVLPSENEWYKAAYYDPRTTAQGGPPADSHYWLYATMSNTAPALATAINTIGPTRGDIGNPGANVANSNNGAHWNGQNGNLTTVGSAGPLSLSYYGTADQSGNVFEWNENFFNPEPFGPQRGLRGGSFDLPTSLMQSTGGGRFNPTSEGFDIGFRVASVPEPSTAVLAVLALGMMLAFRRRRQRNR